MRKTTSHWWRVRVHATQEEKIFTFRREALAWCRKVSHTFQQTMTFDLIECIEKTEEVSL